LDSDAVNVIRSSFDKSGSPFSLREKVRMRGIESNAFVDDFDPLTPTLSRREREKRRCLSRRDRDFGDVPETSRMFA
jgi:hypothetical protein